MVLRPQVDLYVNGAWTSVRNRVRAEAGISIRHGIPDESSETPPAECGLTLNNMNGDFSPRNPVGAYYGQLGRNTPLRVAVDLGTARLVVPSDVSAYTQTPDSVALSVTGDLDLRADLRLPSWDTDLDLIAKNANGAGQRSWRFGMNFLGYLNFQWSNDGINWKSATSPIPVPTTSGRQAARVTLDVDNGASGWTVQFWTADTISGPWKTFCDPQTGSGVTSVFDSTSPVRVGQSGVLRGSEFYAVEVRNGIGGTVVASPSWISQASGTGSFNDAQGNTWSLVGSATITNRRYRFYGEVSEWPATWDISGRDVPAAVTASGVLRRSNQNDDGEQSALRRTILGSAASVNSYWPMEDESGATQFASAVSGRAGVVAGSLQPQFAADSTHIPASAPLPLLGSARLDFPVAATDVGAWQVSAAVYVPSSAPSGALIDVSTSGSYMFRLYYFATGALDLQYYNPDGSLAGSTGPVTYAIADRPVLVRIEAFNSGGAISATSRVLYQDSSGASFNKNIPFADAGRPLRVSVNYQQTAFPTVAFGHLLVQQTNTANTELQYAFCTGVLKERAARRYQRLLGEQKIFFGTVGLLDTTPYMGKQGVKSLADLLQECVDTDLALLAESRGGLYATLRDRTSRYDQRACATIPYALLSDLQPVTDDQTVRNDVTVDRDGGASSRQTLSVGTLSTQYPPNGVGPYADEVTLSLYSDGDADDQAMWRLHMGTVDEDRYPTVTINLAHPKLTAQQVADLLDLVPGDRVVITGTPRWMAPGPLSLIALGFTESIDPAGMTLTLTCVPESPYRVLRVGDTEYGRVDTVGSYLATAVSSTATSWQVASTDTPWVTTANNPGEFPFDVQCAGEWATVTGITSAVQDAFGRTASNGWGTADVGGSWTTTGGSASDFNVSSSRAGITLTTTGTFRTALIPVSTPDVDLGMDVLLNSVPAGATIVVDEFVRYVDSSNYYVLRLQFNTDTSMTLILIRVLAGAVTTLATTTLGFTLSTVQYYRMRASAIGSTLRAKVWPVGTNEPGWIFTVTDTGITGSSQIGVRAVANTGNTNTNPIVLVDNVATAGPQIFTVTRSVNGVVKALPAGAAVRLARPNYIGL